MLYTKECTIIGLKVENIQPGCFLKSPNENRNLPKEWGMFSLEVNRYHQMSSYITTYDNLQQISGEKGFSTYAALACHSTAAAVVTLHTPLPEITLEDFENLLKRKKYWNE